MPTLNKALWGNQMELIVEGAVQDKLANSHTVPSTHKFTLARERLAITRTRMDTNLGIPIREGRATPN